MVRANVHIDGFGEGLDFSREGGFSFGFVATVVWKVELFAEVGCVFVVAGVIHGVAVDDKGVSLLLEELGFFGSVDLVNFFLDFHEEHGFSRAGLTGDHQEVVLVGASQEVLDFVLFRLAELDEFRLVLAVEKIGLNGLLILHGLSLINFSNFGKDGPLLWSGFRVGFFDFHGFAAIFPIYIKEAGNYNYIE